MENDNTLTRLRAYIKSNGGIAVFADDCGVSARLVYSWLDGSRRIQPTYAKRIEIITYRRFRKEKLIFAQPSV